MADGIRALRRCADALRRAATQAGDILAAWEMLVRAAALERQASLAEVAVDEDLG